MGGTVWDQWDIWTVNLDGTKEHRLTEKKFYQAFGPRFSPDNHKVLFWAYVEPSGIVSAGQPGSDDIAIGDLAGDGTISSIACMPTAPGPDGNTFFAAQNREGSFSPDGRMIVFLSNRVGGSAPYDYEVWLADPTFGRMVQLTHLHFILCDPGFTRDGQFIVFGRSGTDSMWRIKPDGTDLRQIR